MTQKEMIIRATKHAECIAHIDPENQMLYGLMNKWMQMMDQAHELGISRKEMWSILDKAKEAQNGNRGTKESC